TFCIDTASLIMDWLFGNPGTSSSPAPGAQPQGATQPSLTPRGDSIVSSATADTSAGPQGTPAATTSLSSAEPTSTAAAVGSISARRSSRASFLAMLPHLSLPVPGDVLGSNADTPRANITFASAPPDSSAVTRSGLDRVLPSTVPSTGSPVSTPTTARPSKDLPSSIPCCALYVPPRALSAAQVDGSAGEDISVSVNDGSPSFGDDETGERLSFLWEAVVAVSDLGSAAQDSNNGSSSTSDRPDVSLDLLASYMEAFNARFSELSLPFQEREQRNLFEATTAIAIPPRSHQSDVSVQTSAASPAQLPPPDRRPPTPSRRDSLSAPASAVTSPSSRPDSLQPPSRPSTPAGRPLSGIMSSFFQLPAVRQQAAAKPEAPPHQPASSQEDAARPPSGHPHAAVVGAIAGLGRFVDRFEPAAMLPPPPGFAALVDRVFLTLRHCEVLARYADNRDALIRHEGLQHIMRFLRAAVPLWTTAPRQPPLSTNAADDPPVDIARMLAPVIQCALAVVSRCTDPDGRWRKYIRSGGRLSAISVSGVVALGAPGATGTGGTRQLAPNTPTVSLIRYQVFSECVSIVAKVLLRGTELEAAGRPPALVDSNLRAACLTTLGALIACRPTLVRNMVIESSALRAVYNVMALPPHLLQFPAEQRDATFLRVSFRTQVLAWSLISYLTHVSGACIRRIDEMDGFRNMRLLFEWVAAAGPDGFASEDKDYMDFVTFNSAVSDSSLEPEDARALHLRDAVGDYGTLNGMDLPAIKITGLASSAARSEAPSVTSFRELDILFERALSSCLFIGSGVEQAGYGLGSSQMAPNVESLMSPMTQSRSSGSTELSSQLERVIRILVKIFMDDLDDDAPMRLVRRFVSSGSDSNASKTSSSPLKPHIAVRIDALGLAGRNPPRLQLAFLQFLRRVLQISSTDGHQSDASQTSLNRGLCIGWMDQLHVWKLIFGVLFFQIPSPQFAPLLKACTVDFVISASSLPEHSNSGAVLSLLKLVSVASPVAVAEGPLLAAEDDIRIVACDVLTTLCESPSSCESACEALLDVRCLNYLVPALERDTSTPRAADSSDKAPSLPELEFAAHLRTSVCRLLHIALQQSPELSVYVVSDKRFRSSILWLLPQASLGSAVSSVDVLRSLVVCILVRALSASHASEVGAVVPESAIEAAGIPHTAAAREWMAGFFACFPETIASSDAFSLQLDLLNLLRSLIEWYPSRSRDNTSVRHALITSGHVLEHLLSVFSVPFSFEDTATPSRSGNRSPTPAGDGRENEKGNEDDDDDNDDDDDTSAGYPSPRRPLVLPSPLAGSSTVRRRDSPAFQRLFEAVISTLDMVMSDSHLARKAFVTLNGYEEIRSRILVRAGWNPWRGLVDCHFGLLVPSLMPRESGEQSEAASGGSLIIGNPDVLDAILSLYLCVQPAMQVNILERLERIASSHEMNRIIMTRAGMVMKVLGNYSISVSECKALLRSLRFIDSSQLPSPGSSVISARRGSATSITSGPRLSRRPSGSLLDRRLSATFSTGPQLCVPYYYDSLLKSVYRLAQRKEADLDLFYFSGVGSGIVLPRLERWPGGAGYSFVTWFQVEEPQSSVWPAATQERAQSVSKTVLFSCRNTSGGGIEIAVVDGVLPWYAPQDATIFINGAVRASSKLDYPDVGPYDNVCVGASVIQGESAGSGRMASVYIMDDVLNLTQLNALYELGPGHSSQFRVEDATSYPEMGRILFDGTLFGRILMQFYPTATRTRGASSYYYPLAPGPAGSTGWPKVVTETPTKIRAARLATFLKLLAVLMGEDAGHMERFASVRGPRILGMLLQQQQPAGLSMKSLDGMMTLSKVVTANLSGGLGSPTMQAGSLVEEIEESLIFDFHIWSVAPPAVQVEHMQFLFHLLTANSEDYRSRYGIIYLMDNLEAFHWLSPPEFLPPDVLARLILARQDNHLVGEVRRQAFATIAGYASEGGVHPDEFSRIVLSLFTAVRDPGHLRELLSFFLDQLLLNPSASFLEAFLAHGEVIEAILWILYKSPDDKTRVLCLKMVLFFLMSDKTPERWKKKLRFEEPPFAGSGSLGLSTSNIQNGYVLGRLLATNPPTRATFSALLQLALEERILDWSTDREIKKVSELQGASFRNMAYLSATLELFNRATKAFKGRSEFRMPGTIAVALADVLFIVRSRSEAGEAIRQLPGWPLFFVELVAAEELAVTFSPFSPQSTASSESLGAGNVADSGVVTLIAHDAPLLTPVAESEEGSLPPTPRGAQTRSHSVDLRIWTAFGEDRVADIAVDVLTALLYEVFDSDKRAWKWVEETTLLVWLSKRHSLKLNGITVIRKILLRLLRMIKDDLELGEAGTFSVVKLENVWNLLVLTEEFLFNYQDLRDEIVTELRNFGFESSPEGGADHDSMGVLLNLDKYRRPARGLPPRHNSGDLVVRISHPAEECRELVLGYMGVINSLLDQGITQVTSSNTLDKGAEYFAESAVAQSCTTEEQFVQMVTSDKWSNLYDNHLHMAMRAIEQEEFSLIPAKRKRYARGVKPIVSRLKREEQSGIKAYELIAARLQQVGFDYATKSASRLSDRLDNYELERRISARQWLAIFRELTKERGIWSLEDDFAEESDARWKLDRTENYLRMRRRLVQNHEFDSHQIAAARRDRVSFSAGETGPGGSLPGSPRVERAMMAQNAAAALAAAAADRRKAQVEQLRAHYERGSAAQLIMARGPAGGSDIEDDEWNLASDDESSTISASEGEKTLFSAECEMILLMTAVKGRLEITTTNISFTADLRSTAADLSESDQRTFALLAESELLIRERRWPLFKLRQVFLRRYMLRRSAIEFFFTDQTNYLFNFKVAKDRVRIFQKISQLKPPNLLVVDGRNPADIIKNSNLTERWRRHEISNFEYLMHLNTISGRTYNDLTQYPVFPWILSDYTSSSIDLSDPSVYRDLSKPIGALDPVRLEQFIERYESFEDPTGVIKKFMYGTHYSSSASVLYYLLRMEPFTSLHIGLQGGKFDHPDRQFHSVEGSWSSVRTGNGDLKELIPEFFYMPEFLTNENKFDLGMKQTGVKLGDVVLPPWANSPEEFVRVHREALEGDYVSAHLHEWIDLIWGYKQTGEEAVRAHNVFYYLTYEGAIDIDGIKDPLERKSIEDQINNFGQTPSQLFRRPHVQRLLPRSDYVRPSLYAHPQLHKSFLIQMKSAPIRFVAGCGGSLGGTAGVAGGASPTLPGQSLPLFLVTSERERLVTVDGNLVAGSHRFYVSAGQDVPFQFEMDPGNKQRRHLPSHMAFNIRIVPQLFAVSRDGRFLFSAGHWDASFQVISNEGGGSTLRTVDVVYGHHDIVTCLAVGEDGRTLVTGSRDATAIAWELFTGTGDIVVRQDTRRVFYGHDEEVTSVAVNVEHDLVLSGSNDGTCIVHSLHEARYIRTVRPAARQRVDVTVKRVAVTSLALLVVYSEEMTAGGDHDGSRSLPSFEALSGATHGGLDNGSDLAADTSAPSSYLDVFSLNGKRLRDRMFTWQVTDLACAPDGSTLVAADSRGGIVLLAANSLSITHRFDVTVPVTSVALADSQQFMFMGRADGKLLVMALDAVAAALAARTPALAEPSTVGISEGVLDAADDDAAVSGDRDDGHF
ncbi:Neurobeachin-like protein 1, partial [Cladochytrium tenue]